MNMLPGRSRRDGGDVEFGAAVTLALPTGARAADGREVLYGMRPGALRARRRRGLPVEVVVVEPTGADTQLYCRFNGQDVTATIARPHRLPARRPHRSRARSRRGRTVRRGERATRLDRVIFSRGHNDNSTAHNWRSKQ